MSSLKALIFFNSYSSFVKNDEIILNFQIELEHYLFKPYNSTFLFFQFVKQFFKLLFNKYDLIYIWFADYHSFIPVLLSKLFKYRVVIVAGGYDVDEILIGTQGNFKQKIRRKIVYYSFRKCNKIISVSNCISNYLTQYGFSAKTSLIYNCVGTEIANTSYIQHKKDNLIITIGGGGEYIKEAKRKRLDLFIELGNEFNMRYPEYKAKFYIIGHNTGSKTREYLVNLIAFENVKIQPMTKSVDELTDYLNRASIYMQLSYYESFGVAQAEAMLFGCIPVSNSGGALPEVVGDAGFIIDNYDTEKYLSTIKNILDGKHEGLRIKARNRVLENFSFELRKQKILNLLNNL